jgi:hypothetical protein
VLKIANVSTYKKDQCETYFLNNCHCEKGYRCSQAHGVVELRREDEPIEEYMLNHVRRNPDLKGLYIDLDKSKLASKRKVKEFTREDFTNNLFMPRAAAP